MIILQLLRSIRLNIPRYRDGRETASDVLWDIRWPIHFDKG
jgi:hypothetical protein